MPKKVTTENFQMDETVGYTIYLAALKNRVVLIRAYQNAGYEITPEQFALLNRLWEDEGVSQRELAEGTFKDKPNVTRIIDQLEKKKFVERHAHESDRRRFCLFLTSKGKKARKEIVAEILKLGEKVFEDFSEKEKKELMRLVRKYHSKLEEAYEAYV